MVFRLCTAGCTTCCRLKAAIDWSVQRPARRLSRPGNGCYVGLSNGRRQTRRRYRSIPVTIETVVGANPQVALRIFIQTTYQIGGQAFLYRVVSECPAAKSKQPVVGTDPKRLLPIAIQYPDGRAHIHRFGDNSPAVEPSQLAIASAQPNTTIGVAQQSQVSLSARPWLTV